MDWDTIYIRAKIGDKWGSHSLNGLWESGEGGQIFEWALERLGSLDGVILTKENLEQLVSVMESLGVGIVKIKKDL